MNRLVALWITGLICLNGFGQVTFVVEEIPSTTPGEDTIYICGTFNDWNTNLKEYALTKQLDGKYSITLTPNQPYFEYKFTRGSFQKVETDESNNYIANRIHEYSGHPETVNVKIVNWVDLGGVKPINLWVFYFFTAGIIGVIISALLISTPKRKVSLTHSLLVLTLSVSLILIGRALYGVVNPIYQSYLLWVFNALLFIPGPSAHLIRLSSHQEIKLRNYWPHFIPALILLVIALIRISDAGVISWLSGQFNLTYKLFDTVLLSGGLLHTGIYLLISLINTWPQLKEWNGDNIITNGTWSIMIVGLVSSLMILISGLSKDLFFALLSLYIFLEGYLYIRNRELFQKTSTSNLVIPNSHEIIGSLHHLMEDQKPYMDPALNITDLAEQLGIKPHILSKLLNDEIKQNFRDYVNAYRIKEFIQLSREDNYKNYTFLALAHTVGFNSKSTFNNAFKKVTNQTPREYFKNEGTLEKSESS